MTKKIFLINNENMCTHVLEIKNWNALKNNNTLFMDAELFSVDSWNCIDPTNEIIQVSSLANIKFSYDGYSNWKWKNDIEIYSIHQGIELGRAIAFSYKVAESYLHGFKLNDSEKKEAKATLNNYTISTEYDVTIKYL